MNRFWQDSYPPGMATEISIAEYASLGQLFEQSVALYADRTAFVSMGTNLSYRALDRLSRRFGAYLRGLGLPSGARVALALPNTLQYPIAMFGILRAGYTVVNCNPLYTAREFEHQLKDSGAAAIVVVETAAAAVAAALPATAVEHVITTGVGDMLGLPRRIAVNFAVRHVRRMVPPWHIPGARSFREALALGRTAAWQPLESDHGTIAFLQYTGGTTGVPKGAMLTHGNILANLQQCHAWLERTLEEGNETVLTPLPLYHIFALTANCLVFFKIGATNVLIVDPRNIRAVVREMAKHPFSAMTGVNTLFDALTRDAGFAALDFSRLKVALGGGMAVTRQVAERWKQITGRPIVEAYGLTEASPAVTINPLDIPEYNGSIGLPIPSTDVAIRDDEGRDLPVGEVGELCVRGPQVMKGYWKRPEETAAVMMPDGFMRTGDVAVIDERGYVRIVDRKKDMILISGFKIWPSEIEDVARAHPGVLEVGAVGVADERTGEALKLVVVKRDPNLTAEVLIAYCRANLTAYKVPRVVEFRAELPKTNVGKILRRALRDEAG